MTLTRILELSKLPDHVSIAESWLEITWPKQPSNRSSLYRSKCFLQFHPVLRHWVLDTRILHNHRAISKLTHKLHQFEAILAE